MNARVELSIPVGGFTLVAPAQDVCEGDSCLLPTPGVEGAPSLLAGDVRDGRAEG